MPGVNRLFTTTALMSARNTIEALGNSYLPAQSNFDRRALNEIKGQDGIIECLELFQEWDPVAFSPYSV